MSLVNRQEIKNLKPFTVKLQNNLERQHLLGRSPKTLGIRSGYVALKPGEEIGEHTTEDKEELLILLEGRAEVLSDKDSPILAEKNTVVYMPPHTKHNVKNTGSEILRYIYIVSNINE